MFGVVVSFLGSIAIWIYNNVSLVTSGDYPYLTFLGGIVVVLFGTMLGALGWFIGAKIRDACSGMIISGSGIVNLLLKEFYINHLLTWTGAFFGVVLALVTVDMYSSKNGWTLLAKDVDTVEAEQMEKEQARMERLQVKEAKELEKQAKKEAKIAKKSNGRSSASERIDWSGYDGRWQYVEADGSFGREFVMKDGMITEFYTLGKDFKDDETSFYVFDPVSCKIKSTERADVEFPMAIKKGSDGKVQITIEFLDEITCFDKIE